MRTGSWRCVGPPRFRSGPSRDAIRWFSRAPHRAFLRGDYGRGMSFPELSKRGRIVVLIVDDADGLLARTRRALLRAGIDVETATSGPQAMTALSGRPFDLVVLEVGPREVRTSELLREIRSLDHVAVMLVAGREPDADGTRGVD